MKEVEEIINRLELQPHPEGGYFKEVYRSEGTINELPSNYDGRRNYSTSIYFLLTSDTFSAFHKINQDEIWHFYQGSPIELHVIAPNGKHKSHLISNHFEEGHVPQLVVPGNHWFAAKVLGENTFGLVGCTVAPGFDFQDFTLPERQELLDLFPQHGELIVSFTRP